jgi:hypothetical protein
MARKSPRIGNALDAFRSKMESILWSKIETCAGVGAIKDIEGATVSYIKEIRRIVSAAKFVMPDDADCRGDVARVV